MATKAQKMQKRIEAHGEALNKIFGTNHTPVTLCKKLRALEKRANMAALDYCNGYIEQNRYTALIEPIWCAVGTLLGNKVPFLISGDPRGYALKIDNEIMAKYHLKIHADWGGYGILAPDLTEE